MDPFVVVELNSETKYTSTKDEAGEKPEWNETLEFENTKASDEAKITVWDDDGNQQKKRTEIG